MDAARRDLACLINGHEVVPIDPLPRLYKGRCMWCDQKLTRLNVRDKWDLYEEKSSLSH